MRTIENVKIEQGIVPVSQTAAGSTTGAYIDAKGGFTSVDFIVGYGALADGKKLTIEVLAADDARGTDATKLGEVVVTAPTGGSEGGTAAISTKITAEAGRYYAVKVTNDAAAAVLVSAVALLKSIYAPTVNKDAAIVDRTEGEKMPNIEGFKAYAHLEDVSDAEVQIYYDAAISYAGGAGLPPAYLDNTTAEPLADLYVYAMAAHFYDRRSFEVDGYIQDAASRMRLQLKFRGLEGEKT